jgi:hypothetical protein
MSACEPVVGPPHGREGPALTTSDTIWLTAFERHVRVDCADRRLRILLALNYGQLAAEPAVPDLVYAVGRQSRGEGGAFIIHRNGQPPLLAATEGHFLFLFEKDVTVELQKLRQDLYFVHSAVLRRAGGAFMLVGPPGSGKSTATWGLLHHGCEYLSDELAPVDLRTLEVLPYPHALCLKQVPPGPYRLPASTLRTWRALYVPAAALPGTASTCPAPLLAIFFCAYDPLATAPALRPLSGAEAATRLFVNTLNALAHPGGGLDGAIQIARRLPAFELVTAELPATCAVVAATLDGLAQRAAAGGLRGA